MNNHLLRSPGRYAWIALALALLAFGLRLYDLGGDSLWYDEILTVRTAERDLADIWTFQSQVSDHPPLLYVLTHLSLKLGRSDFVVRLPSALLGALAVPLVYRLGCAWGGAKLGLSAALLVAISPFHIRYSQEARHYAPLATMALASLLSLYQGLRYEGKIWWAAFVASTVVGFYTHYASFIVLAVELAFAAFVIGRAWVEARRYGLRSAVSISARWLTASVLIVVVLYVPWIPSLVGHVEQNLGPEAARATAVGVPIGTWMTNAFYAFGVGRVAAFLFGALCLVECGVALRRREWEQFWLILVWLLGPFLLIQLVDVSRYPFPKYVAYVSPVYLLSVAAGGCALLDGLAGLWPRARPWVSVSLAGLALLLLAVVSLPAIGQVYAHVERDWKGAVQYLGDVASEGDVFVTATLDLPSGFDQGRFSLSYYLKKVFGTYYLLSAADVSPDLDELGEAALDRRRVWALVIDRDSTATFDDPGLRVVRFEGGLFLIHLAESRSRNSSALEESIALFETLARYARSPQPRSKLLVDLAILYKAAGRFEEADETLERALNLDSTLDARLYEVLLDTYHGLLERLVAQGRTDEARAVAWEALALDARDEAALETLTVFDFIAELPDAEVEGPGEPFPQVDTRVFTMPATGNWKPTLFMHPPTEATYRLTLPDEATELLVGVAVAPESWDWGGDGSTFTVRLRSPDGHWRELFSQHVSNAPEDRRWHEATIDLAAFAGEEVVITLATGPGPQGDFTGDWAGWGAPRIVWSRLSGAERR